ncbi:S8 family serine peptidase [Mesomycoplasma dispar]|uniref:Serine protease n=1 Tax=Mesomycoplasma dispar TaxID=86660 RepID=A0ABM6PRS3_9BACT|nr:S8 family serine peptidase [Mesomycoplasma dispar]ATP59759.1 serine protease [Mesomycoplasma dispar]
MKLKKFRKIFLLLLFSSSIFFIHHPFFINQNFSKKYWYSINFSNKIIVRDSFAKTFNNSSEIENSDNQFELKLLLNPDFLSDESKKIVKFNLDFINEIKKSNLKFKEAKNSKILPIVWFYFDTESDREFFVKNSLENPAIDRYIVYKNEDKDKQTRYIEMFTEEGYYENKPPTSEELFKTSMLKNMFIVNFYGQSEKDKKSFWTPKSKVGAIEVIDKFDKNFSHYFNNIDSNISDFVSYDYRNKSYREEKNKNNDYHSTLVSLILASKMGFDQKANFYLSIFRLDSEWQKAIEWMVEDKNVKVINHSYGNGSIKFADYDENSYFLDFLSRKYGVINVFAAGNGAKMSIDGTFTKNPWIDKKSLSLNSIVVGALNNNSATPYIAGNKIADYSNYKNIDKYYELAKPLVVAPGYVFNLVKAENSHFKHNPYDNEFNKDFYDEGTSYAAPIVTGLISTLLREKPNLDNNYFRVPALKAILSVSAISPDHTNLKRKESGYFEKYGSGIPDFENMLKATKNTSFITEGSGVEKKIIFTSDMFWVESNKKIKASLSWMFNAGLLKNKIDNPRKNNNNWWLFFGSTVLPIAQPNPEIGTFVNGNFQIGNSKKELTNWSNNHINYERLKLESAKKNQDGKFFSDYDLYLQKRDSNGKWVDISSSKSFSSNDELIDFTTSEATYYRIYVKKYNSVVFENSVDDKLAVSYLVHNEN